MLLSTSSRSRRTLAAAIFLAAFSAFVLFSLSLNDDAHQYSRLTQELFLQEMQANTLNMHYTIAHPEDFGITDYEAVLPCYSQEATQQAAKDTRALLSELSALDASRLSEADRFSYGLLCSSLESTLEGQQYAYYEEPLSPASGMQSQLPILLAEYHFRSLRDVEDYLAILDQTDEYFEALLQYEQEKAAAGLLMPATSLRKVIEQCDTILTREALDQDSHFLQLTFQERLAPLLANGQLTAEQAEELTILHNRLLRTVMLPAYTALGDGLLVLEDPAITPAGLCTLPQGKAYYEYLLRSVTGSDRSIDGIRELLTDRLTLEYEAMRELLLHQPKLAKSSGELPLSGHFPCQSASEMLQELQRCMAEDFPKLPEVALNTAPSMTGPQAASSQSGMAQPTAAIKPVSESLQEYCAPAFYLTPPLDDTSTNAIYINQKNMPDTLELFTTLAHEGYPGHMYQTIYHNRQILAELASGTAPVRELLWYGGYVEGWALYVEFHAYEYAAVLAENSLSSDTITQTASVSRQSPSDDATLLSQAVRLLRHDRSLLLCMYSLLDIMIHYEGASQKDITAFLGRFGITDPDAVTAIYEYIVEEPVNYLKYYLGYLEILELQEEARVLWGDDYSDLRFHTFLLDWGPADFASLRQILTP